MYKSSAVAVVAALRKEGAAVSVLDLARSIERNPVPQGARAIAMDATSEASVQNAFNALDLRAAAG